MHIQSGYKDDHKSCLEHKRGSLLRSSSGGHFLTSAELITSELVLDSELEPFPEVLSDHLSLHEEKSMK